MFHYTNLGIFGSHLKQYADLNGYVPEEGDQLTDFNYPEGWFDNVNLTQGEIQEDWNYFVGKAVMATHDMLYSVDALQNNQKDTMLK